MPRLFALYRDAFRGLSREVWVLSLALFVNRCGTMVLPYLTLYLTREHDYSAVEAGGVLSLYGLGAIGGIALGGWLTDRIGFHWVMRVSLAVSGLGFIFLGQVSDPRLMAATAVALGFVGDAFRPANAAATAAYSRPQERTRAFGLNRLAINLGWTAGPAFGGFLALHDYGLLFWVDGITCIASAVFLTLALSGDAPTAESAETHTSEQHSPWRDTHFLFVFLFILATGLIFFQVQSTFPLFLGDERGLGEDRIGLLLAVNTLLIVLVEMPLVKALEGRDPLRMMAVGCIFLGLGFGLMPLCGSVLGFVLLVMLWTIGEMLNAPTSMAWVANRAGAASRGSYMAAFGICFSSASVLAPWLGTRVYAGLGSSALWYGCLGLGLVAALGLWILSRIERAG